jgi:hypothetical protein
MRWKTIVGVMCLFGMWSLAACTAAVEPAVPTRVEPVSTGQVVEPVQKPIPEFMASPDALPGQPQAAPAALQFIEFYSPL